MSGFQALVRGLCPTCRSGRIFAGRWRMNDSCPVCGTRFERAPGYFVGAMYISYAFAVAILFAMVAVFSLDLFSAWPIALVVAVAIGAYLLLVPALFRWSRIIWIHIGERVGW